MSNEIRIPRYVLSRLLKHLDDKGCPERVMLTIHSSYRPEDNSYQYGVAVRSKVYNSDLMSVVRYPKDLIDEQ